MQKRLTYNQFRRSMHLIIAIVNQSNVHIVSWFIIISNSYDTSFQSVQLKEFENFFWLSEKKITSNNNAFEITVYSTKEKNQLAYFRRKNYFLMTTISESKKL
jgi:hypothetical protein